MMCDSGDFSLAISALSRPSLKKCLPLFNTSHGSSYDVCKDFREKSTRTKTYAEASRCFWVLALVREWQDGGGDFSLAMVSRSKRKNPVGERIVLVSNTGSIGSLSFSLYSSSAVLSATSSRWASVSYASVLASH